MNVLKKIKHSILMPIAIRIYARMPIKQNRIVVDNFGGRGFGDNPKYVVEELMKRGNYEIYWNVWDKNEKMPKGIKVVKNGSFKKNRIYFTSKVWIDNIRNHHPVGKRNGQIYLQTWHGGMGVKRVEKEAEDTLDPKYVELAKIDGKLADGILVSNSIQLEQFKRAFWLSENCEILKFGLPRNDQIFESINDENKLKSLRKKFNIKDDDLYILYAPTFRDDKSTDGYKLDFENIIKSFEKLTNKKCHIIIKLHPNALELANFIEYNDSIINGSIYPDILELSYVCDYLITDYSSTVFDFSLMNKPAFICAIDYQEYKKIRGILPLFEQLPYPTSFTSEQLCQQIEQFSLDKYNQEVNEFFEINPVYDDGHAAEKTVDWLIEKMK